MSTIETPKKTVSLDEDEYKAVLGKNVTQATEIIQLKNQLKDSTDALVIIKTKMDAAEKEEKDSVIDELVRDSQGKLTKERLSKDSLDDLYLRKETIQISEPKTFVSVMKQREADQNKPPVLGTVGAYNQNTGKFEGGITA